ncbi:hypothetical protein G6F62_015172 [Rhizopus arrhizus]|nr:hypothetical protein G6F62_015172 [Rhizopus arrhizus]
MGDAAGIGPEIVVKAYAQGLNAPCVVSGDTGALRRAAAQLGARLDIVEVPDPGAARRPACRADQRRRRTGRL